MSSKSTTNKSALRTIEIEHKSILALCSRIGAEFEEACELILQCSGRVVVTGMGKSGHIGNKIAATLASTGTPSLYVHPGEASHGDIGMITDDDVVLAISNSGNTEEIIALLPIIKRKNISLISFTGNKASELSNAATVNIDVHVDQEACPLGLAPTSSTTAALVMGDALAMALLEERGFTREDFAFSHPGGNLGRRVLVKVRDLMHTGNEVPRVKLGTSLAAALLEMTKKGFGLTTVIDDLGYVKGVFSDGDLRRALDEGKSIDAALIDEVMSSNYKCISSNSLAAEAALVMQKENIYVIIVGQNDGFIEGILKMHDLLQANVI